VEKEQPYLRIVSSRYGLLKKLGRGGMGTVFLAEDLKLNREKVALKILHSDHISCPIQRGRFLREAQLMRKLNHPNLVRTFDVNNTENSVYFAMEYVEGRALDYFMDETEFPASRIPDFLKQVSAGLAAIHKGGVVHRDLKPGNILILRDGQAKITDFGVARVNDSDLTAHNEIIGSPNYVAPEIWLGKKITPRSDIYSLGIILYELLTGDVPFDSESPAALMKMHLDKEIIPPRKLDNKVPAWLSRLNLRLLAKSPKDRPQSADEIYDYVSSYAERGFSLGALGVDETANKLTKKFVESLEQISCGENEEGQIVFEDDDEDSAPLYEFNPVKFEPKPKKRSISDGLIPVSLTFLAAELIKLSGDKLAFLGIGKSSLESFLSPLLGLSNVLSSALFLSIPLIILSALMRHYSWKLVLNSVVFNSLLIFFLALGISGGGIDLFNFLSQQLSYAAKELPSILFGLKALHYGPWGVLTFLGFYGFLAWGALGLNRDLLLKLKEALLFFPASKWLKPA